MDFEISHQIQFFLMCMTIRTAGRIAYQNQIYMGAGNDWLQSAMAFPQAGRD